MNHPVYSYHVQKATLIENGHVFEWEHVRTCRTMDKAQQLMSSLMNNPWDNSFSIKVTY